MEMVGMAVLVLAVVLLDGVGGALASCRVVVTLISVIAGLIMVRMEDPVRAEPGEPMPSQQNKGGMVQH